MDPVSQENSVENTDENTQESKFDDEILKKLCKDALIHNLDVFTDIWYFLYVPVKNPEVKEFLWNSLVIPNSVTILWFVCVRLAMRDMGFL